MLPDFSAFCGVRWAPQNAIGPSTLFQAYKTIKHMEKQGREAGWKTLFIWLWANMFYAHRQRKWIRLLQER